MTTFISYSRANSDFAMRLANDLKQAGLPVWLDQLDIPAGSRWDDGIEKALHASTAFVVILSPEAMQSQNVKDEIGYAIDAGKHILPIVLKQTDMPFRLRRFQFVDSTKKNYASSLSEIQEMLTNADKLSSSGNNPLETADNSPRSAPIADSRSKKSASKADGNAPPSTPPAAPRKPASNSRLIVAGLIVVAILAAILLLGQPDNPATKPESTTTLEAISPTAANVTKSPTQALQSTPSPEPTAAPSPFFSEEFNAPLSGWSTFVASGDITKLSISLSAGRLVFDLSDAVSDLYAYYILDSFTYSDVKLETTAINKGSNVNDVSLICRYSESGWYEFNVANEQTYTILAYDSAGIFGQQGYNVLFEGASATIKSGQAFNTYAAICQDNTLTLYINEKLVRTITDNQYHFAEGKIGLSVSSFTILPVNVQFENLIVSQP